MEGNHLDAGRPIGLDLGRLQERVHATYDRVARAPDSGFHFRTGAAYAVEVLGYSRTELDRLPAACTAPFAGVGNPLRIGAVHPGATVLDHACGAGMDLLLAARRIGRHGRAVGVDLTPAMREQAARAADEAGLGGIVDVREGTFEDLPVADESVDYVLSNGVLNLAPDKQRVLAEVARVLKPGGKLYLADVVLSRELLPEARCNADLWASCVAGALMAPELEALAAGAGLTGARIVERFECFRGTAIVHKFRGTLDVFSVNFTAEKRAAASTGSDRFSSAQT